MAFNFRPKNVNEIGSKKKSFGDRAIDVWSFVKETYGEIIILDPSTNFSSIKIPRIVEDTDNITTVKKKLKKIVDLTGLNISFGNGSGSGGSSMNAAETAKQENATRLVCEHFIEKGKMPTAKVISAVYSAYDDGWAKTFEMQASALKSWLGNKKGYEYSRDIGIMPYVEGIALSKCGVSTKDSWNPADIYIVKKDKRTAIEKKLKSIGDMKTEKSNKLDALNDYMKDLFIKKFLVGISLKKLGKTVKLEETNVTGNKLQKITLVKNSINCNLDLDVKGEFTTGELSLALNVDGSVVNVQVRAFSGGERESTQMDMTGSGAAAKLGKVSSREAIDPFLNKYGLSRRMGSDIPKVGNFTAEDVKFFENEQTRLSTYSIMKNKVNFGSKKWSTSFAKARTFEKDNNRTASQLSAKLQCFMWIEIFNKLDNKNVLSEFLNVLYYGAKKQYASAGPFLKIS
jgi:hypothetical protein|tara:strand:+ start:183 stop:1553 length:1371 start_codon:yes stop_codon:yes gene_type:complete